MIRKATLTPAAVYIRMSSGKQEKSPAEQRAEIDKLAAKHDCQIVQRYNDDAITGDSDSGDRPGLADLLTAAKAGKFKVVLIWHTNRLTREHPMDALALFNVLRKAGVRLVSCCEGTIDLDDFSKQLLLFIGGKGNHDYLTELSAKVLRGLLANAKQGKFPGGRPSYGMERALFDPEGRLVCRLKPGEYMTRPGHTVKLVPTSCPIRRQAVCYAFQRFDEADISLRALAKEMQAKGFPAPRAGGWHDKSIRNILNTRAYIGMLRWNHNPHGKYNQVRAGELVSTEGNELPTMAMPDDPIEVADAHEGFIDRAQFDRVQSKLASQKRRHPTAPRVDYPLTGLLVCKHCGKPMQGHGSTDHRGNETYVYKQYNCSTYLKYGHDHGRNTTCLSHTLDAHRVLGWIVHKLQETFLGPRKAELIQEIKTELTRAAKGNSADVERLQRRAGDLDREVGRLVKAIRTIDAAELVEELSIVRAERDRVKAELDHARKMSAPTDLDSEAERLADTLAELGEALDDAEPAVLREVLRQFVSRIVCEWEPYQTKGGKVRRRFKRGTVELRPIPGYNDFDYCEARLVDGTAKGAENRVS